jgi:hypothetical protein
MQPLGTIYNALVRYIYSQTDRADRLMGVRFGVFVTVRCVWEEIGTFGPKSIATSLYPMAAGKDFPFLRGGMARVLRIFQIRARASCTQLEPPMRIFVLTTLICCTAIPVFAHESDDAVLHNIAHLFDAATVVSGPEVGDCTLSGGTQTTCFSITVKPEPQSYTPGPWCPTSVNDSADKGGIWLENGQVNDVDGAFVANLSTFYDDPEWQLFDADTGKIRVTDTQQSCEAAARPDVDPEYNNYCVQCLPEYMPDDGAVTYVIPLKPQAATG